MNTWRVWAQSPLKFMPNGISPVAATERLLTVEDALARTDTHDPCSLPKYQVRLTLICAAAWYAFVVATMLPPFLMPRLEAAWSLSVSLSSLIGSLYFFGNFCGILAFGLYMDLHGRRSGVMLSLGMASIALPATFACIGPVTFACVRIASGLASGGITTSTILLVLELSPRLRRARFKSILTTVGWSSSLLIWIAVAYALRRAPWRALVVATLPVPLTFATAYRLLDESPRFLLKAGDERAALVILRRIAVTNGRPLPEGLCLDGGGLCASQELDAAVLSSEGAPDGQPECCGARTCGGQASASYGSSEGGPGAGVAVGEPFTAGSQASGGGTSDGGTGYGAVSGTHCGRGAASGGEHCADAVDGRRPSVIVVGTLFRTRLGTPVGTPAARRESTPSLYVRTARTLRELCHPSLWHVTLLVSLGFMLTAGGYYAVALSSGLGGSLDLYSRQLLGALIEVHRPRSNRATLRLQCSLTLPTPSVRLNSCLASLACAGALLSGLPAHC